MRVHDDHLAAHLRQMYDALILKPEPSLEDLTTIWLLADTLFLITLDLEWYAIANGERSRLDARLQERLGADS